MEGYAEALTSETLFHYEYLVQSAAARELERNGLVTCSASQPPALSCDIQGTRNRGSWCCALDAVPHFLTLKKWGTAGKRKAQDIPCWRPGVAVVQEAGRVFCNRKISGFIVGCSSLQDIELRVALNVFIGVSVR